MGSDLMHLSGFYLHLDERDFSQDRVGHIFFIPTFGDSSFAKSFIYHGLSSFKFFIERFFQCLIYQHMIREFPYDDSIIHF